MRAKPASPAHCCSLERQRLVAELRQCDICSDSYESHSRCFQAAARESGQRSKACMVAA